MDVRHDKTAGLPSCTPQAPLRVAHMDVRHDEPTAMRAT